MDYKERSLVVKAISSLSPRDAAEHAYILATLARKRGDMAESYDFAELCISLLSKTPAKTLADCATKECSMSGVALPSILHDCVVRERFPCFPDL